MDEGVSGRRVAAYAVGGLGLAGLAVGGVFGVLTLTKKNALQEAWGEPGAAGCDFGANLCTEEGQEKVKDAKVFGWISTVGFGVGVAGLGAATVLLLTEPSGDSAASGTGEGRRAVGVRAALLGAGPQGAVFGMRGAW